MRESRFLTSLMILAMAVVDLAALAHAGPPDPLLRGWPTPELVVLFSLAFSQVSLVSVWAGLGGAWVPWRAAGMTFVVTLWSIGLTMSVGGFIQGYNKNVWTVHLLSQAAMILGVMLLLRWRGSRLVHRNSLMEIEGKEENAIGRRRFQFSISYLFAWMTAIAITLGMFQYTVDFASLPSARFLWGDIFLCNVMTVIASLVGLPLTWNSCSLKRRTVCLSMVALPATALLVLSAPIGPGSQPHLSALLALFLLEIVWLAAAFSVLRVAGWRMVTDRSL